MFKSKSDRWFEKVQIQIQIHPFKNCQIQIQGFQIQIRKSGFEN